MDHVQYFLSGVVDSFCFQRPLYAIYQYDTSFFFSFLSFLPSHFSFLDFYFRSSKIRNTTFTCILLNGVIFLGSIQLFNRGILPILDWIFEYPLFVDSDDNSFETSKRSASTVFFFMYHVTFFFFFS